MFSAVNAFHAESSAIQAFNIIISISISISIIITIVQSVLKDKHARSRHSR